MKIIKETIPGCGSNWYNQRVIDRMNWLLKNIDNASYRLWYENKESDIMYVGFENDEDATLYMLSWTGNE